MGEGMIPWTPSVGKFDWSSTSVEWRAAFEEGKDHPSRCCLGNPRCELNMLEARQCPGYHQEAVIDVAIAVRSFEVINSWYGDSKGSKATRISAIAKEEATISSRRVFRMRKTFYVHVVPIESDQWRDYLKFRDALLANSPTRTAYADLKRLAAENHTGSRSAYTEAKDAWIRGLLNEKPGQPMELTPVAPSRSAITRPNECSNHITDIVGRCFSANALFIVGIDGCGPE